MTYYTRQRTPMVPAKGKKKVRKLADFIQKDFNPDQPRDENGRWVAVSFGKSSFGTEFVAHVHEKGNRSRGRGQQEFQSMAEARAHAQNLNAKIATRALEAAAVSRAKAKVADMYRREREGTSGFKAAVRLIGDIFHLKDD